MRKMMKKAVSLIMASMLVCTLPGMTVAAEETTAIPVEDDSILNDNTAENEDATVEGEDESQPEDSDASLEEGDSEETPDEETDSEDTENEEEENITEDNEEETIEDLDVFEEYPVDASVFDDVNQDAWYCPYVSFVLNKGIMTGKGNNNFDPETNLSRAEFAVILHRLSGLPEAEYNGKFADVPEGKYYTDAVSWASSEEIAIINGYEDGSFRPNDFITREEMVVMFYRYAESNDFDITKSVQLDSFPDAENISEYAVDGMKWAVGIGLLKGDDLGNLNPQGKTTRAVTATMLLRYCNKYMNGQFENIDLSASCGSVSAEMVDAKKGSFKVTVTDPQSASEIKYVQAKVYSQEDKSDSVVYYLTLQEDGTYQITTTVVSHGCNFGTYTIEVGILLSNGVKIPVGSTTLEVEGELASCESVTAEMQDANLGTFKVTATKPYSILNVPKIEAVAYTKADKSDKHTYYMTHQSDGSYQATVNPKYHGYNFGDYTVEVNLTLSNGMVVTVGKTTISVNGKESTAKIYEYVYQVYDQVGRDLNKCYWWVVNNLNYQTLTIHLTPPTGYTRSENYALYGFQNKKGNCYVYAATFYYLAKGLGYDCSYIEGQVGMASGGYGPHGWVAIYSNGSTYICDPEAQDEAHLSRYNFYMQPKSSPVLRYVWP